MELLTNGWNILLILLGFGLLIFVHELGHFAAARWARLRCESFAIGMGPVLVAYRPGVGWAFGSTEAKTVTRFGKTALAMTDEELAEHRIGETEYSLRVLPLGGFVRLLGQEDLGTADANARPRSYTTIAIWKRMVVISGGVVANLIGALALFMVAFMVGVRFEAPIVGAIAPGSPAANADIRPGDTIVSINGSSVLTFADVQIASAMAKPGSALTLVVKRPGVTQDLQCTISPEYLDRLGMQWIGIGPASTRTITTPRPRDLAEWQTSMERSGLAGHSVAAGATLERANGEPLVSVDQLQDVFAASKGKPVELTWENIDGTSATTSAAPSAEYQVLFGPTLPKDASPKDLRTVQAGLAGLLPLVRVTAVQPDSPNVGLLMPGDVLLRVATTAGPSHLALGEVLRQYKGNGVPLELLRNGERVQLLGRVNSDGMLGVAISGAWDVPMVAGAVKALGPPSGVDGENRRSPASSLDMLPLSRVTSIGGTPVSSWLDMRGALQQAIERAGDAPAEVAVEIAWDMPTPGREPTTGTLRIDREDATQIAGLAWASPIDPTLFAPEMVTLQADGNPLTAVSMGFRQTSSMIKMTYLTIDRLVRGSVGVEQLRGPVGIVHLGSTVADRGAMYLVFFLAAISVNLAVLNFLPLPIVDGGLFLYLLYERITGKPPSVAFQNAAILVGLCLLGGIFLLTFYQDVMRLVGS